MKKFARYLLILFAVLILWNTVIIKPLKIFTVFLHEFGHALMAFIFGNGINGFGINFNESGYTIVKTNGWFSSFMIANGGYLGSILFALFILYSKRMFLKKYILGLLAIAFLLISTIYSNNFNTIFYSVIFTIVIIIIYMIRNEKVIEWVIDIIGISSAAYAIYDTFVDTILVELNNTYHLIPGWSVSKAQTDAVQLANMTGIPALIWGILWLVISLTAVGLVLLKRK